MNTCAICKGTRSLFTIDIPCDDDSGTFERHVCGSCWEVIAEIANRRLITRLDKIEKHIKELDEQIPYLQDALKPV